MIHHHRYYRLLVSPVSVLGMILRLRCTTTSSSNLETLQACHLLVHGNELRVCEAAVSFVEVNDHSMCKKISLSHVLTHNTVGGRVTGHVR